MNSLLPITLKISEAGRRFFDDHAARPLYVAMVSFVLPRDRSSLFDAPLYSDYAQLEEFDRLPDLSTVLRFRHRL